MSANAMLILGLVLAILAIPTALSDWADERRPYRGGAMVTFGLGLVAAAVMTTPDAYSLAQIPDIFFQQLALLL